MPNDQRGFEMPYRDFWRRYLQAHSKPATRGMHYAATLVGLAGTIVAIVFEQWLIIPGGILVAIGMAVGAHRFIERNHPLIRINPLYGAICDLRMFGLALTGRLGAEYRRLGLPLQPIEPPAAGFRSSSKP